MSVFKKYLIEYYIGTIIVIKSWKWKGNKDFFCLNSEDKTWDYDGAESLFDWDDTKSEVENKLNKLLQVNSSTVPSFSSISVNQLDYCKKQKDMQWKS